MTVNVGDDFLRLGDQTSSYQPGSYSQWFGAVLLLVFNSGKTTYVNCAYTQCELEQTLFSQLSGVDANKFQDYLLRLHTHYSQPEIVVCCREGSTVENLL